MSHEIDKHIGRKIRIYRQFCNISQIELAAHLNLTRQTLQQYETGLTRVNVSTLFIISEFLNINIGDFFPNNIKRSESLDSFPSSEAREFIHFYQEIPEKFKPAFIAMVNSIIPRR
ncbi:helix-turn-helix domain-containing protein [Paracoccus aminophilus]|uniref:Transcriptional regulator, XRE family n=1 Tax=Paracoccus aminophilus JCM 7686 TaxID=1367847 RepID=S5XVL0_PARAH|nr:helix-turn-helix transcriptional regulator [Paracoccus aminophilus]AGT09307.1 transcriptional regulator, XRE family [Paracoccus aminophilus JCM 7686]